MSTAWILLIPALIGLLLWWLIMKKRKVISGAVKERLLHQWAAVMDIPDLHRRVLEGDKILESALGTLGFGGTMADKLKKAGPRLPSIEAVWSGHKLRNRIAHEPGMQVNASEAGNA